MPGQPALDRHVFCDVRCHTPIWQGYASNPKYTPNSVKRQEEKQKNRHGAYLTLPRFMHQGE